MVTRKIVRKPATRRATVTRRPVVKKATTVLNGIGVEVGRMDKHIKVTVANGTTILDALKVGGFKKADTEVIQDLKYNECDGDEKVEAGAGYYFVSKTKSGC